MSLRALFIVSAMWSRSETTDQTICISQRIATPALWESFVTGYHVSKLLSKHNKMGGGKLSG